jgi:hypothetical protein
MKRLLILASLVIIGIAFSAKAQEPKKAESPPAKPAPTQILVSTIGDIKVELLSGNVSAISFKRRTVSGLREFLTDKEHLIITVRITNDGEKPTKYAPWHGIRAKSASAELLSASQDIGFGLRPWLAGTGAWPVKGIENPTSIHPKKSIEDMVAFAQPEFKTQEVQISLPGANVGQPNKSFRFKITRQFFEDEATRKINLARIAKALKERDADREKRERQAKEAERIAAQKAAEDAKPKISRANYNKLAVNAGMSQRAVEFILGPGRETSQVGDTKSMEWRIRGCTILLRFRNDVLVAKSIFDD